MLRKMSALKRISVRWALQNALTTYYDAWEHDDEDDPALSLIYEIMKENYCKTKIDNQKSWKEILINIASIISSRNLTDLFHSIEGKDIFEAQKNNESLETLIEQFFRMLLPENGNKLIIFIDELDRCTPKYAIKLLERINKTIASALFNVSTNIVPT